MPDVGLLRLSKQTMHFSTALC